MKLGEIILWIIFIISIGLWVPTFSKALDHYLFGTTSPVKGVHYE